MYRIEMWSETGHWTVRVPANRARAKQENNPRLRHNQCEWIPTGGSWVALGGLYASEAEAEEAMARFMACGSYSKPLRFRAYRV